MKVEVIKSCGGYWYSTRTGEQFDVKDKHDSTYYVTVGDDVRHIHEFHCKEILELEDVLPQNRIDTYIEKGFIESPLPKLTDAHYDNSNGSLYKFAADHDLNAYEFDIIKRIVRCRKKGRFEEDLEKTIRVIELYIAEYDQSSIHSRCYGGSVKEENKKDNR
jgi:hypothetical protein